MNKIKKIDLGIKTLHDVYIIILSNGLYTIGYSIVDYKKLSEAMQDFYTAYPRENPLSRIFPKYPKEDTLEFFVKKVHNFFTTKSKESKKLRIGSQITLLGHTGIITHSRESDGGYYINFGVCHATLITQIYTPEILELANNANQIHTGEYLSPHFKTIDNLIKFVNTVNNQKPMQKPHVYHIGDKVRIKERKGNTFDYPFAFIEEMAKLKGSIHKISGIEHDYISKNSLDETTKKYYNGDDCKYFLDNFTYAWHSSMFEPVLEDSEPQILTSLKVKDLVSICGMVGRICCCNDFGYSGYYLNLDTIEEKQKHYTCCKKLRTLVPNFDKMADKCGSIKRKFDSLFPEFSTISDLMKFIQAVNNVYSEKSITTPKTLNEYEPNRLQKPKASLVRGSVPEGHSCSGRKNKTAVVSGHLSYRVCNS